jgi:RNA recognition motif-containing protein
MSDTEGNNEDSLKIDEDISRREENDERREDDDHRREDNDGEDRGRERGDNGDNKNDGEQQTTSLLVRNISHHVRSGELRQVFQEFGELRDIYIPTVRHKSIFAFLAVTCLLLLSPLVRIISQEDQKGSHL